MIPILLIWKVKIKRRQKLGLAAFLCLSICMIIIAIIRVSGLYYKDTFDSTWIFMWQEVEACVAVTMLSLTAFRSIFVSGKVSVPNNNHVHPWVPSTTRLRWGRKRAASSNGQALNGLVIPSATLTGLTGFIGNRTNGAQSMNMTDTLTSSSWPPAAANPDMIHSLDTTTLNSNSWRSALEPHHQQPSSNV